MMTSPLCQKLKKDTVERYIRLDYHMEFDLTPSKAIAKGHNDGSFLIPVFLVSVHIVGLYQM